MLSQSPKSGLTGTKEPWHELDWYVGFAEDGGSRNRDDARQYGFVSTGGGEWYSRTLRNVPVGGRIFVMIPKLGYVGVRTIDGPAALFHEATVMIDGDLPLAEVPT